MSGDKERASTARRQLGWVGLGAIAYSAISLALDVLGLPGDLERWRSILGPITADGLRQLSLLSGFMLLAPLIVEYLFQTARRRREKVALARKREREAEAHAAWARAVLPHLTEEELHALRLLLVGPRTVENAPDGFTDVVRSSYGRPSILALRDAFRRPVAEYLEERDRAQREEAEWLILEALRIADRPQRTVLWAFGQPHLQRPPVAMFSSRYRAAVTQLARHGVLRLEPPWTDTPLQAIHLSEAAKQHVEKIILKRPAKRTTIRRPVLRSADRLPG